LCGVLKCGQCPGEVHVWCVEVWQHVREILVSELKCYNVSKRYVCGLLKCGNVSERYVEKVEAEVF